MIYGTDHAHAYEGPSPLRRLARHVRDLLPFLACVLILAGGGTLAHRWSEPRYAWHYPHGTAECLLLCCVALAVIAAERIWTLIDGRA